MYCFKITCLFKVKLINYISLIGLGLAKLQDANKPKGRYTTVSIPVTLYNRIKELIKDTGFTSVSQYVTYVLREIVAAHEEAKYSEAFSEEDKKRIIEKLKKLGYL